MKGHQIIVGNWELIPKTSAFHEAKNAASGHTIAAWPPFFCPGKLLRGLPGETHVTRINGTAQEGVL